MDQQRNPRSNESQSELRCDCGRLLARVVAEGIELRCGRCKQAHVLAWTSIEGAEALGLRSVALGSKR